MKHLLYFIPLLFLSFIYPDREKLDIKVSQHIEHQTYRAITYNINESFEDPKAFAEEKNVQVALDVDTVQHKVLSMQISYKADATFSEGNLKFIKKAEVGGDIMDSVKLESTFSYLWETKNSYDTLANISYVVMYDIIFKETSKFKRIKILTSQADNIDILAIRIQ